MIFAVRLTAVVSYYIMDCSLMKNNSGIEVIRCFLSNFALGRHSSRVNCAGTLINSIDPYLSVMWLVGHPTGTYSPADTGVDESVSVASAHSRGSIRSICVIVLKNHAMHHAGN